MNNQLWKIRIVSFLYSLGTLIGLTLLASLLGVLESVELSSLMTEHLGKVGGTIGSLLVIELVKNIRNLKVLKDAKLGGKGQEDVILI